MDQEIQRLLPRLQRGVQRVISTCCQALPSEVVPINGMQTHAHPMREILFQLHGKTIYPLGGKFYPVQSGDALFIEPMQEHGLYFAPGAHDLQQCWIILYPKRLNIVFITLDGAGETHHQLFYCSGNNAVYQILQSNWEFVSAGKTGDPEWGKHVLRTSLDLVLCDAVRNALETRSLQTHKKREDIVNFLFDYIDGNHGCGCALEKLEKLTGFSRYYLSHLYREYYGKTIGDAVNEARMRFLLAQNWHANAKELAEMLGFTSAAIFWKWRRKHRVLEETLRRELKK